MESIPFTEFNDIFQRTPARIFQGNYTAYEINKALAKARDESKIRYFDAENQHERAKTRTAVVNYDHLISYGFANRVIKEAKTHPNGPIANRLRRIEAERRMAAQRRGQMRYYRRPDNWGRR